MESVIDKLLPDSYACTDHDDGRTSLPAPTEMESHIIAEIMRKCAYFHGKIKQLESYSFDDWKNDTEREQLELRRLVASTSVPRHRLDYLWRSARLEFMSPQKKPRTKKLFDDDSWDEESTEDLSYTTFEWEVLELIRDTKKRQDSLAIHVRAVEEEYLQVVARDGTGDSDSPASVENSRKSIKQRVTLARTAAAANQTTVDHSPALAVAFTKAFAALVASGIDEDADVMGNDSDYLELDPESDIAAADALAAEDDDKITFFATHGFAFDPQVKKYVPRCHYEAKYRKPPAYVESWNQKYRYCEKFPDGSWNDKFWGFKHPPGTDRHYRPPGYGARHPCLMPFKPKAFEPSHHSKFDGGHPTLMDSDADDE